MVDRLIALAAVVIAAAYAYGATTIRTLDFGDPIGPRTFPFLIAIILVIGAGVLLLETAKSRRLATAAGDVDAAAPDAPGRWHFGWMIAAVSAWMVLYILVFERLGYVLSTAVFLFGLVVYFHPRHWVSNIAVAVLMPVATYYLFHDLLHVNLPAGLVSF